MSNPFFGSAALRGPGQEESIETARQRYLQEQAIKGNPTAAGLLPVATKPLDWQVQQELDNAMNEFIYNPDPAAQAAALQRVQELQGAKGMGEPGPAPEPVAPEPVLAGLGPNLAGARVPLHMPEAPPPIPAPPPPPDYSQLEAALQQYEPVEAEPLSSKEKLAMYLASAGQGAARGGERLGPAIAGAAAGFFGAKEGLRQQELEASRLLGREQYDKAAKLAELDLRRQEAQRGHEYNLAKIEYENQLVTQQHNLEMFKLKQPQVQVVGDQLLMWTTEQDEAGNLSRVPQTFQLDPIGQQLRIAEANARIAHYLGASKEQKSLIQLGAGSKLELAGIPKELASGITAAWMRVLSDPNAPDVKAALDEAKEEFGGRSALMVGDPVKTGAAIKERAAFLLLRDNPAAFGFESVGE